MSGRALNDGQHRCLERIAGRDEYAIVTGWSTQHGGPIVEHSDGTIVAVATTGRSNKITE